LQAIAQTREDGRTTAYHPHPFVLPGGMDDTPRLTPANVAQSRRRRLVAMRLQEIAGNPLTSEDVAMFEMFEREAWPHERRRAYLLAKAKTQAAE
jgi:hypothetical protein